MMALCGSLAACAAVTVTGVVASSAAVAPAVFPVTITVDTSGTTIGAIDDHFVGLSFDSTLLNSGLIDNVGDLPQLMRNLGSSVMRFGGGAVDGLKFSSATPGALAGLARLATATGWTVIYSENLGHYDAATVKADAGRVSRALGGRLAAFACGNEPNLFGTQGLRPATYREPDYIKDARACIAQIQAGAPGAPVEGADLTGGPKFLAAYAKDMKGKLAFLGQHYYPLGCGLQGMTPAQFATGKLLAPATTPLEAAYFTWAAADATAAGTRLWITEGNSACQGGAPGASNSYASALWMINYLLTGATHGVARFNLHGGLTYSCDGYTPLCPVPGQPGSYTAQPDYYGMLFTRLLGSGHLLPVKVATHVSSYYVTAFALKPASAATGLRVLVENMTGWRTAVTVNAGGNASRASVLRLTAPSLLATSGVTIQGAAVTGSGGFQAGAPTMVACSSGRCPLSLGPYSAALVSFG
jgi:hypothetical protein